MTKQYTFQNGEKRNTVTIDPATLAVLPPSVHEHGGLPQYTNTALVIFCQHVFDGKFVMVNHPAQLIAVLADHLNTSPSAVVRCALAWRAGRERAERGQ